MSSIVVPRSNPSAILLETESEDRSSWFFVSPRPRKSFFSVKAKTREANSTEACQTGSSSNVQYFMLGLKRRNSPEKGIAGRERATSYRSRSLITQRVLDRA